VERETGKFPSVILLQNHGIIVHDDDADRCLKLHADANGRLAKVFGLNGESFPEITVEAEGSMSRTNASYLKEKLKNCRYDYKTFIEAPLYPDQMVFLVGTFFMDRGGELAQGECVADTTTGGFILNMGEKQAQTVTQTVAAVIFIMEHIEEAGYTLSTMGGTAKRFIANWESEKYRKSLAEKDKGPIRCAKN
jgi:hypothetical protein